MTRSRGSRNARELEPLVMCLADVLLCQQWIPEQIAGKLPVSHVKFYMLGYADKANDGKLKNNLRCQMRTG